jgi:putative ABC transport system ATP-binding protein
MLIEIKNLSKLYSMEGVEVQALKGINLQIARNEYVAIMGPSGSGKSTLMNILDSLDTPTEGHYLFNDVDVSSLDDDALSSMR